MKAVTISKSMMMMLIYAKQLLLLVTKVSKLMVQQLLIEKLVMDLLIILSTGGLILMTSENASSRLKIPVQLKIKPDLMSPRRENVLQLAQNILLQMQTSYVKQKTAQGVANLPTLMVHVPLMLMIAQPSTRRQTLVMIKLINCALIHAPQALNMLNLMDLVLLMLMLSLIHI